MDGQKGGFVTVCQWRKTVTSVNTKFCTGWLVILFIALKPKPCNVMFWYHNCQWG